MRKIIVFLGIGLLILCVGGCSQPNAKNIPSRTELKVYPSPTEEASPSPDPTEEPTPEPPQPVTLGSFSTPVLNAEDNRVFNMQLACQAINGMVIEPGITFSFNGVVGEASAQRGYKESDVIVGEQVTHGEGGGVCQVSSTLYNAAVAAGMTIVERHDHNLPVGYVAQGLDAAISYGSLDLKFRNDTGAAVVLYISAGYDAVVAQITN